MKKQKLLMLVAVALVILSASAQAAMMSSSADAPAVNGEDIASFAAPTGSDKWWPEPAGGNGYGDPGKTIGQTFTTGSGGVMLNSFTFQIREATKSIKEYTIRVGTVSETTFTEIYTDTATQDFDWGADDYVTWTFAKPVLLSANTVYGVDVGLNSSTSPWWDGIPYVHFTADEYPDGTRFRSGTAFGMGVGDDIMGQVSGDRVFHIDLSILGASDPEPTNGATVPAGDVELSWTNANPNYDGGSVWVDVWFGTDPNEMSKVVTAGENTTSNTVDASAVGTFYWQVDSYIYGPGNINEPNMIEGPVWTFNTVSDQPPTIDDMGADMITWSGQAVQLDSTVTDDGVSDLTHAWSAFPADGVVFTPGADDPNPTVTITKDVGVSVIGQFNPGFEDPRDAGSGFVPYPDGDRDYIGHLRAYTWMFPNWGYYYSGYCGVYNPVAGDYNTGEAPEGQNVGFVQSLDDGNPAEGGDPYYTAAGGLAIDTPAELKANTEYTLTVKVGNPLFNDDFPGYRVQLLAGGSLLVEDNDSLTIEPGTFITSELSYTSDENPAQLGQKLGIRLMTVASVTEVPDGPMTYEVHFDDVKLVSDGDATVTLTLAVNDENNPAVEDTMTIDVYDTACLATVIGKGIDPDPGDFNSDCVTNNGDLDELTGTWLTDSTLTEPAVQEMTGGSGNNPDDDPNDPDVEAGSDWRTWSGEPVTANATVVNNDPNDPQMDLTYAWTADADSLANPGFTIEITNDDQEDATVTITRVSYFAPFVANGGFEAPALDENSSVNTNSVPFWSTQWAESGTDSWTNDGSPNGGAIEPNESYSYGGAAPEGENIGYVTPVVNDHCLYQELSATVQASVEHVLSVKVGNPSLHNGGAGPNYRIELWAGDVVIASASGASPDDDSSWLSVSCSSTAGADDVADPNVGQTLAIRLIAEVFDEDKDLNFDDVELLIDGEAGDVDDSEKFTVTLTLAANNVESERADVEDSMTIDVYDSPCKATITDPADANEDCFTDLKDFAVMALDWLSDYTITEPVPK